MKKIIFIFLFVLLIASCAEVPDDRTKVIVTNSSDSSVIYAVYTCPEGSVQWTASWTGAADAGSSASFYLEPGMWNVRIVTGLYGFIPAVTGNNYKEPVSCGAGGIVCLVWDGSGLEVIDD